MMGQNVDGDDVDITELYAGFSKKLLQFVFDQAEHLKTVYTAYRKFCTNVAGTNESVRAGLQAFDAMTASDRMHAGTGLAQALLLDQSAPLLLASILAQMVISKTSEEQSEDLMEAYYDLKLGARNLQAFKFAFNEPQWKIALEKGKDDHGRIPS